MMIRPNKKISVFWVTGLKSYFKGRVGTHIFFYFFFLEKNIILCILKAFRLSKCIKYYFFSRKLEKKLGFTRNLGSVGFP